ncbi:mucin-5AC-like [Echinops telfairi]|uniref:Mucin-5AC-like n=1 Tax=Echinops telfairi TaxID=9371 RepID=A0AC55CQY4_ECHTE|nr:mucin-5AC-like [Echinops telfairi]
MNLLQGTILSLLLSGLCCSESNPVNTSTTVSAATPATVREATTKSLTSSATKSTVGTSPTELRTDKEILNSSLPPTSPSLKTPAKVTGSTTNSVTKNELPTTSTTVTNIPIPNPGPTIPSSQQKTENQTSIKATDTLVYETQY